MNDETISQKSPGKNKLSNLSIGLCILFLAVHFSFLCFFPFTPSLAFFRFLALLFIVSVLVSLVSSFFTRKALIPLALLIIFGIVCTINYHSFQSEMQNRQTEMAKQLEEQKLRAKSAEKIFNLYQADLTPANKEKAVLFHFGADPLLITQKNWRGESILLSAIQFFDNMRCPDDSFIDGKTGWLGSDTVVTGYYFGLFYTVSTPVICIQKGIVRPDGSAKGNLIVIDMGITSSSNGLFSRRNFINESNSGNGAKTLSFSKELRLLPSNNSRQASFAEATWKYVPAAPDRKHPFPEKS